MSVGVALARLPFEAIRPTASTNQCGSPQSRRSQPCHGSSRTTPDRFSPSWDSPATRERDTRVGAVRFRLFACLVVALLGLRQFAVDDIVIDEFLRDERLPIQPLAAFWAYGVGMVADRTRRSRAMSSARSWSSQTQPLLLQPEQTVPPKWGFQFSSDGAGGFFGDNSNPGI